MRLDRALVDRGLADSRARAQALISAGVVTVDGAIVRKAAAPVAPAARIAVTGNPNPWVSRAALKLLHALTVWDLAPTGIALDIGASTGGFTQVLLARGAERVWAIDVGHGQLAEALATDPRVVNLERTNARDLPTSVPAADWIVSDVSFISLTKALPPALVRARSGATLVALIKPQFEAGPADVGKGGIVKDPSVRTRVSEEIARFLTGVGWEVRGLTDSPITGSDGNREMLIHATKAEA